MKQKDPYSTPTLGRVKPKRHLFHSLIQRYRHRSDTGLVEDRTSSVTIVRIIVGLLMLHLIIIGGVLLRGHMVREGGAAAVPLAAAPPNKAPAAPPTPAEPVLTPPPVLAPTAAPVQQATQGSSAASNHITQAVSADEEEAEEVAEEVVEVTSAATSAPIYHMVATGDTWQNIAAQYAVSLAALRAANPGIADSEPRVGDNLVVPTGSAVVHRTPRDASVAQPIQPVTHATPGPATAPGKVHVVQRGETLSRISRKVKVPMKELMLINGIKDANRISPGMRLRLSR